MYNKRKPYEEDYDSYGYDKSNKGDKEEEDLSLGALLVFGFLCSMLIGIMFFLFLA